MGMRLHLMSDLHLDHDRVTDFNFIEQLKPQPDIDLLVLAGDWFSVCRPAQTADLFRRLLDLYQRLLVVPGNHEYWHSDVTKAEEAIHNAAPHSNRLYVITTPRFEEIGGQRFLGGTLWYRRPAKRQIQDFVDMRKVEVGREWFFKQQHDFQTLMYKGSIEGSTLEDTIVVTHHLPHPNSTPEKFRESPTDHFFMCNMTGAIMDRKPKMWLHGHTHDPCDYVVGATRIICNPRGYPHEYNARAPYEPKLIEV